MVAGAPVGALPMTVEGRHGEKSRQWSARSVRSAFVRHVAEDAAAIESAYHRVSKELAGVAGMLGNELWRGMRDDGVFVVVSRWLVGVPLLPPPEEEPEPGDPRAP